MGLKTEGPSQPDEVQRQREPTAPLTVQRQREPSAPLTVQRQREPSAPLTVLSVAYPFAPVGLDETGGAEQILAIVDDALWRAGHRSIVVACAGSRVKGELIAGPAVPDRLDDAHCASVRADLRKRLAKVVRDRKVDIVHMHGLDFTDYVPSHGVAVLATLHLPPDHYAPNVFAASRKRFRLACVSRSQLAACPPTELPLELVGNGIRWKDYEPGLHSTDYDPSLHKSDFVLALGRICPEKGFHLALDAAKRARVPMVLAGRVFPYEVHEQYFAQEIAPRLDEHRRYIGSVGLARKRQLLRDARAVLVSSLIAETSSLVAMEALASATPVIAFAAGALPEIVRHGQTGFIVSDVAPMAEAIAAASGLDREACRQAAREHFSSDRMVQHYLDLYRALREERAG